MGAQACRSSRIARRAERHDMAAPVTPADFLALVRKSGLLDSERLDAGIARIRGLDLADTPRAWAKALLHAGLLTLFQAEQLLQGKCRGFSLGPYKVLERLGAGGMGIVYLCEHTELRHRVAVKVLPLARSGDPAALGRFYREAARRALLDHPNLIKAHGMDREGPLHFLVLDYVEGVSLHQLVAQSGPLSPLRAAHYARQTAEGLEHARRNGLVHRDIKPANLLVDRAAPSASSTWDWPVSSRMK